MVRHFPLLQIPVTHRLHGLGCTSTTLKKFTLTVNLLNVVDANDAAMLLFTFSDYTVVAVQVVIYFF